MEEKENYEKAAKLVERIDEKRKEKMDFYGLGQRKANDVYENALKIAEEIEKVYGSDARLQYECGIVVSMEKRTSENIENIIKQGVICPVKNTAEDLRNNSYFGTPGVSNKYNTDGTYHEPGQRRRC